MCEICANNQTATVIAGAESRAFNLSRGVKQGDPISALLFIPVMEVCFRNLKKSWHGLNKPRLGQYYGMVVDRPGDPLTHRRFADDVLLIAESKGRVIEMPADLKKEAALYGLVVHMGKTSTDTCHGRCTCNRAGGRGPGRGVSGDEQREVFGTSLGTFGPSDACGGRVGGLSRPCWCSLGAVHGRLGALLGAPWAILESSWADVPGIAPRAPA